jgi:hypothetical protein
VRGARRIEEARYPALLLSERPTRRKDARAVGLVRSVRLAYSTGVDRIEVFG